MYPSLQSNNPSDYVIPLSLYLSVHLTVAKCKYATCAVDCSPNDSAPTLDHLSVSRHLQICI